MNYDKTAAGVGYRDEDHIYEKINTGERYTSVTTLIHKYVPEFKSEYWSLYKAIKDHMEFRGDWVDYKLRSGGWEKVVDYFKSHIDDLWEDQLEDIASRKESYLTQWAEERDAACELGSRIHNYLENASYDSQRIYAENHIYETSAEALLDLQDFGLNIPGNFVYPELLIHSDKYMVAGQIDKCFKQGATVDIHDYKTNKKLNFEGFRGETLLGEFSHLPNANYYIYTLQLSVYARMLELLGYEVRSLYIHHLYGDNRENLQTYKLDYLRAEAQRLLELNLEENA